MFIYASRPNLRWIFTQPIDLFRQSGKDIFVKKLLKMFFFKFQWSVSKPLFFITAIKHFFDIFTETSLLLHISQGSDIRQASTHFQLGLGLDSGLATLRCWLRSLYWPLWLCVFWFVFMLLFYYLLCPHAKFCCSLSDVLLLIVM